MENDATAKEIFDAWLGPLRDLGARRNVIETCSIRCQVETGLRKRLETSTRIPPARSTMACAAAHGAPRADDEFRAERSL